MCIRMINNTKNSFQISGDVLYMYVIIEHTNYHYMWNIWQLYVCDVS